MHTDGGLGRALASLLANKLASRTLLPTQLASQFLQAYSEDEVRRWVLDPHPYKCSVCRLPETAPFCRPARKVRCADASVPHLASAPDQLLKQANGMADTATCGRAPANDVVPLVSPLTPPVPRGRGLSSSPLGSALDCGARTPLEVAGADLLECGAPPDVSN